MDILQPATFQIASMRSIKQVCSVPCILMKSHLESRGPIQWCCCEDVKAPPQEHVLPMDDTPVQEDGEAELQMVAVKPKATGGLGGSLSETQNGDVSEETVGGGKVKKKKIPETFYDCGLVRNPKWRHV